MSTTGDELEFRRLQKQWWWFDPRQQDRVAEPVAWDWEILRRVPYFRNFQELAKRVPKPPTPQPIPPGTPLVQAAAEIFAPFATYREKIRSIAAEAPSLGDLDPRRSWSELSLTDDHCDWRLNWLELSDTSRQVLREARTLFPRQHEPVRQYLPWQITRVTLSRDASGKKAATSAYWANSAIIGRHPDFTILPEGFQRLDYIVILFDTRAGEAVLQLLEQWKERASALPLQPQQIAAPDPVRAPSWPSLFEESDEEISQGRLKKSHADVYPGRCVYMAQAWIPVAEYDEIRAHFHTLLAPRQRQKWLARCKEAWSKPETVMLFGQPVTVPPLPYQDTPDPLKAKSGELSPDDYRVGFPALDWREAGGKVAHGSPLIPFFHSHGAVTDPDLIRDALKTVQRRIDQLERLYHSPPAV